MEHLPQDHTEREHVRLEADLAVQQQLGRHVRHRAVPRRPDEGGRHVVGLNGHRHGQVSDLALQPVATLLVQKHVVARQVAVHHAVAVEMHQAVRHLHRGVQHGAHVDRPRRRALPEASRLHVAGQLAPVAQFHRHPGVALHIQQSVQLHQPRVLQLGVQLLLVRGVARRQLVLLRAVAAAAMSHHTNRQLCPVITHTSKHAAGGRLPDEGAQLDAV
mmetsp:Transcript_27813/g.69935  ORF Transcript_27813/g.69935 Transcript_27813/m.69935 type:complete len:217 (-) Transcript_27813:1054-1704(-)